MLTSKRRHHHYYVSDNVNVINMIQYDEWTQYFLKKNFFKSNFQKGYFVKTLLTYKTKFLVC